MLLDKNRSPWGTIGWPCNQRTPVFYRIWFEYGSICLCLMIKCSFLLTLLDFINRQMIPDFPIFVMLLIHQMYRENPWYVKN